MLVEDIVSKTQTAYSKYEKIAIYSGRFQPPHIGHLKVWQHLRSEFDDAFIATSDVVSPPRSPFNFLEKKTMFRHAGVPVNRIVQVRSPYLANEIVSRLDPKATVVIFGVSEKDMHQDKRFSFAPKKDGSPSFLQSYEKNINELAPIGKHAYVTIVPTVSFNINGKKMTSATEFRANFSKANDSAQAQMIQDLYGKYSDKIHALMREKIV
jgi:hypothetical protein